MGVDVDEAGGDDAALGVDLATARAVEPVVDRHDPVADDADVGPSCRGTGAVDDGAAPDDEVVRVRCVVVRPVRAGIAVVRHGHVPLMVVEGHNVPV